MRARLRSRELCDVEVYEFASDLVSVNEVLFVSAPSHYPCLVSFKKQVLSIFFFLMLVYSAIDFEAISYLIFSVAASCGGGGR